MIYIVDGGGIRTRYIYFFLRSSQWVLGVSLVIVLVICGILWSRSGVLRGFGVLQLSVMCACWFWMGLDYGFIDCLWTFSVSCVRGLGTWW